MVKRGVRRRGLLERPIVVDANVVSAAFIRDGRTREIILDRDLDLRTPPWLWEELAGRHDVLAAKTGLNPAAMDELLRQLRARIADIPGEAIERRRETALRRMVRSGRKDAPYVAAVLAVHGVLWTQDARLKEDAKVPTITTEDILRSLER